MTKRNKVSLGLMLLAACGLLTGCFSSSGGSGGARPTNTYIVMPNGQTVPAQTVPGQPGAVTPQP